MSCSARWPLRSSGGTSRRSLSTLEELVGPGIDTFCYPFGGFHTFDADTERILTDCGIRYAFNVEPRDITSADLRDRPTALPRYDCNAFAHGRAHVGPPRALKTAIWRQMPSPGRRRAAIGRSARALALTREPWLPR